MTLLEITAVVAGGAWLALLTLLTLALVRRVAAVSAHASDALDQVESGLMIGTPLPEATADVVPELGDDLAYLVFLSSTCGPCVSIARELNEIRSGVRLLVVVPGSSGATAELVAVIPGHLGVIEGNRAQAVADLLKVTAMPSALQVEMGVVTGKALLTSVADLERLITAYQVSDAAAMARSIKEVVSSAR